MTLSIYNIIDKLSDNDLRELIRIIETIIRAPEMPHLPDFEVRDNYIKALILKGQILYSPIMSKILNLFDNGEPEKKTNTLIRVRLLQYLSINGGHAEIDENFDKYFTNLGYKIRDIYKLIDCFIEMGIVCETEEKFKSIYIDENKQKNPEFLGLKITRRGSFLINEILFDRVYLRCIKDITSIDENFLKRDLNGITLFSMYTQQSKLSDKIDYDYFRDKDGMIEFVTYKEFVQFIKMKEDEEFSKFKHNTSTDRNNWEKTVTPIFSTLEKIQI